ncbi:hypothetical protein HK102_009109 [Quaeritorhiza haematococci]|nr:hypothetical protein HK102_009109 [Quaeritorhiza haematococci]
MSPQSIARRDSGIELTGSPAPRDVSVESFSEMQRLLRNRHKWRFDYLFHYRTPFSNPPQVPSSCAQKTFLGDTPPTIKRRYITQEKKAADFLKMFVLSWDVWVRYRREGIEPDSSLGFTQGFEDILRWRACWAVDEYVFVDVERGFPRELLPNKDRVVNGDLPEKQDAVISKAGSKGGKSSDGAGEASTVLPATDLKSAETSEVVDETNSNRAGGAPAGPDPAFAASGSGLPPLASAASNPTNETEPTNAAKARSPSSRHRRHNKSAGAALSSPVRMPALPFKPTGLQISVVDVGFNILLPSVAVRMPSRPINTGVKIELGNSGFRIITAQA